MRNWLKTASAKWLLVFFVVGGLYAAIHSAPTPTVSPTVPSNTIPSPTPQPTPSVAATPTPVSPSTKTVTCAKSLESSVKFETLSGGQETVYVKALDSYNVPVNNVALVMVVEYKTTTNSYQLVATDNNGDTSGSWSVGRPRGGYYVNILLTGTKDGCSNVSGQTRFYAP